MATSALQRLSRWWLLVAIAALLVPLVTAGLPRRLDIDGMVAVLELPLQLGLLGLAGLGWLLATRWPAAAAVLLVLVGGGLMAFAVIAYQPVVAVLIAVAFLPPAIGCWLVWRRRRTRRAVVAMAVVTAVLVAGAGFGASAVYGYYLGPAHPVSAQRAMPVDLVVWSWTGGVTGEFPLLHAGALDRPGSRKGGPYSEGAFPGAGQFGTLTVTDDGGSTIEVELAGRDWRGQMLVAYAVSITRP